MHLNLSLTGRNTTLTTVFFLQVTKKDDLRLAANEVPTNDLGSLFKNLKLIVPQEIKKCLTEHRDISTKGRNEMIKNSLVILKVLIDRDQPSAAEFEICAQKIIEMVPQMKDPVPPLRKDVFKPWVCLQLALLLHQPSHSN